ncbi:MAG: PAS domain-containing protein [Rhodospirillaceae bacterium]|nr:PAS domain-containing protein [Rhodospirillaceae bacterium]
MRLHLAAIMFGSALTLAVGILLIGELRQNLHEVVADDLPRLRITTELSTGAQQVMASAPRLAFAATEEVRLSTESEIEQVLSGLRTSLGDDHRRYFGRHRYPLLGTVVTALETNLESLSGFVEQRIRLERELSELQWHRPGPEAPDVDQSSESHRLTDLVLTMFVQRDFEGIEAQARALQAYLDAPGTTQATPAEDVSAAREAIDLALRRVRVLRGVDRALAANRAIAGILTQEITLAVESIEIHVASRQNTIDNISLTATWVFVACSILVLAVCGVAYLRVRTRVVDRLNRLHDAIAATAQGEFSGPAPSDGADEIADIGRAFNDAHAEIARREADRALLEDRQWMVANASPFPVLVTSQATSRIIFINDAALKLIGCESAADVVGRNAVEFYADPSVRQGMFADAFQGATFSGRQLELRLPQSGESVWVLVSCVPMVLNGEPSFYVALNDITEQKAREQELADLNANLERARLEAEQARIAAEKANRSKSEFLATMSHELRTPLNAILGFSEIIRDQALGPAGVDRYSEYAADIRDSGAHLLELINDILDISKIETGRFDIRPEPMDVSEIFDRALRLTSERFRSSGVRVTIEVKPDTPRVMVDRRAAKQILVSLLGNAAKFTPKDGRVTLHAEPKEDDRVLIAVEDTGCGIPSDQLERVLEPFVQVESTYGRSKGGTGLGLTLVQSMTRLHGGKVNLHSTVGVGTRVEVDLPAVPEQKGRPAHDRQSQDQAQSLA